MATPITRIDQIVDIVHGVAVADPYRWLEDADTALVRSWDEAQVAHARSTLGNIGGQESWAERLRQTMSWGAVGAPKLASGTVFSLDRWGESQQPVLVVRAVGANCPDELPRIVADPAALFPGDDTATIDWFQPDRPGKLVALGVSHSGRERSSLYVLDVESGAFIEEPIPDLPFATIAWWPDSTGFAYTCNPEGDPYHRHVRQHQVGNPASNQIVFEPPVDPSAWPDVSIAPDGQTYLVHVAYGWSRVDCHLIDRNSGRRTVVVEGEAATSRFVFSGADIIGVTNLGSPKGRVVIAPIASPEYPAWRTLIDEGENVLDAVAVCDGALLLASQRWGAAELTRFVFDGKDVGNARHVAFPQLGTLSIHGSTPGRSASRQVALATNADSSEAYVAFSSFSQPPAVYQIGADSDHVFARLPGAPDADRIATQQRWASAADGTRIPYFVASNGSQQSREAPAITILSGYGGFALNTTPAWDPFVYVHCDTGGMYVAACVRGGAEGGTTWHRAGIRDRKAVGFDDFIAVGDALVSEGRTSRNRLVIRGSSNGGLLVAAVLTRRPDFCAAVHCAVPLTDMLRYDRFSMARLWMSDYGDPSVEEEFRWLLDYSPYHQVRQGLHYPSVLLTTGREDTRVDPSHARKFAAALQDAVMDILPQPEILLRIDQRAGHGPGKPASMKIAESADVLAFLRAVR